MKLTEEEKQLLQDLIEHYRATEHESPIPGDGDEGAEESIMSLGVAALEKRVREAEAEADSGGLMHIFGQFPEPVVWGYEALGYAIAFDGVETYKGGVVAKLRCYVVKADITREIMRSYPFDPSTRKLRGFPAQRFFARFRADIEAEAWKIINV